MQSLTLLFLNKQLFFKEFKIGKFVVSAKLFEKICLELLHVAVTFAIYNLTVSPTLVFLKCNVNLRNIFNRKAL